MLTRSFALQRLSFDLARWHDSARSLPTLAGYSKDVAIDPATMDSRPIRPQHRGKASSYSRCMCAAVRRANRAVTQLYDAVLSPTGLKATQFILLHAIADSGSVAQWQLAQDNAMAVETLSRRLAALRRKKLIELQIGDHHGEHVYRLTPAGKELFQRALPYWHRAQERLQQVLDNQDLGDVVTLADRLTDAAAEAQELKMKNLASDGDSGRANT
jgi:DNA-binding MarR family transcriptional regulator